MILQEVQNDRADLQHYNTFESNIVTIILIVNSDFLKRHSKEHQLIHELFILSEVLSRVQ